MAAPEIANRGSDLVGNHLAGKTLLYVPRGLGQPDRLFASAPLDTVEAWNPLPHRTASPHFLSHSAGGDHERTRPGNGAPGYDAH
jgi:hypothetical protein